jgi:hypothetical membrane protein
MPSARLRPNYRPVLLWLALGLAFFGSLLLAEHFFPRPYHWRSDVMSDLAEPRFDPHAYLIACVGLAVSGFLLLPFPTLLRQRLAAHAPRTTRGSGALLYLAAIFLTLSGIVPGHIKVLGRAHQDLAHVYGVFISLATIGYCVAALRLPRRFQLHRFAGIFLIIIPFTGFMISRFSLIIGDARLSAAAYQILQSNPWNRLALWEWTAATGTYLFLGLLLTLPRAPGDWSSPPPTLTPGARRHGPRPSR